MLNDSFPSSSSIIERFISRESTNRKLKSAIEKSEAFLAARFGSFEGRICYYNHLKKQPIPEYLFNAARKNAGICNADQKVLERFSDCYLNSAMDADLLAIFDFEGQEDLALYAQNDFYTMLNSLNPLNIFHANEIPWTKGLIGKKLLVIHPFKSTISEQVRCRRDVPFLEWLYPSDVEFDFLAPPNTAGRIADRKEDWFEELNETRRRIRGIDFDVALIGAGAYGLPLGSFVKSLGKVAIHAGGATQLYFGIKGARWERAFTRDGFDQKGWCRPLAEDTPKFAKKIEGGCYW